MMWVHGVAAPRTRSSKGDPTCQKMTSERRAYAQGFDDALTQCSQAMQELAERMRAELRHALDQSLEPDRAKGDPGHHFQ